MLQCQRELSGVVAGVGAGKLRVVIDGETMQEAKSKACKDLAIKIASENGFANAGLCETPIVNGINAATGKILEESEVFDKNTKVAGYRAEFLFTNRI